MPPHTNVTSDPTDDCPRPRTRSKNANTHPGKAAEDALRVNTPCCDPTVIQKEKDAVKERKASKVQVLRLQMIKTIVNSRKFKGSSYDEPRRVQVLDLYCLTRFESENSRRGDVY